MITKRMCLSAGLLVLGLLGHGLGCSSSSDGGGGSSSAGKGGTNSGSLSGSSSGQGGSSKGGSSSGAGGQGAAGAKSSDGSSGGSGTISSTSAKGGSAGGGGASGGTSGGGGGGGGSSGTGTATGGASAGGSAGGNTAKGGSTTGGGTATAGSATAGATSGGNTTSSVTGGSTTGGATTGNSASGGSSQGGSSGSAGSSGSSPSKRSAGCGSANPLKTGEFHETIAGADRQYFVDVPSGYDGNKAYRLIFVWHPLNGTATGVVGDNYNQLKPLSNNTAIFVAANGLPGSNAEASGNGWWNVNGVDMQFFETILAKLNANLCVDQERIFSTGFSFGGMMSYTLPFVFNVFRATAPCSGKVDVIPYTENYPEKYQDPLPIMAFHGDSDDFVKTALGKEFLDRYRVRNKCGTETKKVSPDPCVEYQGCVAQTIWCEFQGKHNPWSEEPAAIWNFFKQF